MAGESVITEELNSLVNKEFGPEVYEIEKGMLRRFAEAIDDPDPRWLKEGPPTFAAALIPKKLLNVILNAEIPLKRLLTGRASWNTSNPSKLAM